MVLAQILNVFDKNLSFVDKSINLVYNEAA